MNNPYNSTHQTKHQSYDKDVELTDRQAVASGVHNYNTNSKSAAATRISEKSSSQVYDSAGCEVLEWKDCASRPLISTANQFLPMQLRSFFPFSKFNAVQSTVLEQLLTSDENVALAAPTGAGKTAVFELALLRALFLKQQNDLHSQNSRDCKNVYGTDKVVYIAPNRALCEERYQDWSNRFSHLSSLSLPNSVQCALVTGDNVYDNETTIREIAAAQIVLTTPEKWDSVTRRWNDHLKVLESVKLLMIDEVHLLADSSRGSCLEAVVCRMKTLQRAARLKRMMRLDSTRYASLSLDDMDIDMRIVAVSATLPNIVDIGTFLEAEYCHSFDPSYRPVPLTTHVFNCGWIGKNQYLFSKNLKKHVPDLVAKYSNGRPSIIFCHTKKETEELALELSQLTFQGFPASNNDIANQVSVSTLQQCIKRKTAYHHAALEASDRHIIESVFAEGKIACLCATSTLAMGVNLPAHLVIIKGTNTWRGAGVGHEDVDKGTLLQMMGRAGRPGFDTSGVAVIMTDNDSKRKFEMLSSGLEVVESQLLTKLVETLNTEISQSVITNISAAITWMKSTFFFVRVRKNPHYYGLQGFTENEIDAYLKEKCMKSIQDLAATSIITIQPGGSQVLPLPASHIMSKHMVPYDVMKRFMNLSFDSNMKNILMTLSECEGLQRPVRRSEKKELNEIYRSSMKYKFEGPQSKIRIQAPAQKAFVLLQCAIGQIYLQDYTLRQEMTYMVDYGSRMIQAAEDYSVEGSKHGALASKYLQLRRSLASSLWGVEDGILNQLRGVGAKTTQRLAEGNVKTFDDVLKHSSFALERMSGRTAPFGQELRAAVSTLLQNALTVSASIEDGSNGQEIIVCNVSRNPEDFVDFNKSHGVDTSVVSYTLVVYTHEKGGLLMYRTNIRGASVHRAPCCSSQYKSIEVRLISSLVGLDAECMLEGKGQQSQGSSETVKGPTVTSIGVSPTGKIILETKPADQAKRRLVSGGISSKSSNKKPSLNKDKRADISEELSKFVMDDIRISKASSAVSKTDTVFTPPITNSQLEKKSSISKEAKEVTPSPQVVVEQKESAPLGSWKAFKSGIRDHRKSPKIQRNLARSKSTGNSNASWAQQKREQIHLQKSAFNGSSIKASNPFSSFKFDPNSVESHLDGLTRDVRLSKQGKSETNCCLRDSPYILPTSSNSIPPGISKVGSKYLQTPKVQRLRGNRAGRTSMQRKRNVGSHRLQNEELLRMKANEANQYNQAIVPPQYHRAVDVFSGAGYSQQQTGVGDTGGERMIIPRPGFHAFRNPREQMIMPSLPLEHASLGYANDDSSRQPIFDHVIEENICNKDSQQTFSVNHNTRSPYFNSRNINNTVSIVQNNNCQDDSDYDEHQQSENSFLSQHQPMTMHPAVHDDINSILALKDHCHSFNDTLTDPITAGFMEPPQYHLDDRHVQYVMPQQQLDKFALYNQQHRFNGVGLSDEPMGQHQQSLVNEQQDGIHQKRKSTLPASLDIHRAPNNPQNSEIDDAFF